MRFALFDDYRPGAIVGDRVHDLSAAFPDWDARYPFADVVRFIENFPSDRTRLEAAAKAAPSIPLERVRLRPPVPAPGKILGAGTNYAAHLAEVGGKRSPEWPQDGREVFVKAGSSVIGPGDSIEIPKLANEEDRVIHEAELTVVIGKVAKNVPKERALEYVFGYTAGIDVTLMQTAPRGERSRRKSHDTFAPIGPAVVTADELTDPHALEIELWVNGELRQSAGTGTMDLKVWDLIEFASSVMTLYPGDLIMTGSPGGAAKLRAGDAVRMEISKIGSFSVGVVDRPRS